MVRWIGLLLTGGLSLTAAPVPAEPQQNLERDRSRLAEQVTDRPSLELAQSDPIAYLQQALRRSQAVRGYSATLKKQERIGDQLLPAERIQVSVREEPFAILMIWTHGARKVLGSAIEGSLFVAGENRGRMKVWRPKAFLPVVDVATDDRSARQSARYALHEGSAGHALKRTLTNWQIAQRKGTLHVEYLGRQPIAELADRSCDLFRRICQPAEVDGFLMCDPVLPAEHNPAQAIKTLTIMIDVETGLQLGSELRREDGALIGSYYFELEELNPKFPVGHFTPKGFTAWNPKSIASGS